jgi:hypothetical protein
MRPLLGSDALAFAALVAFAVAPILVSTWVLPAFGIEPLSFAARKLHARGSWLPSLLILSLLLFLVVDFLVIRP